MHPRADFSWVSCRVDNIGGSNPVGLDEGWGRSVVWYKEYHGA